MSLPSFGRLRLGHTTARLAVLATLVGGVLFAASPAAAAPPAAPAAEPPTITLPIWRSTYGWSAGDGYAGWDKVLSTPDAAAYGFGPGLADQPGLGLWPTGGREYGPGGAQWVLRAPGTTRIARASVELSYRDPVFAHHCLQVGLRTATGDRDARQDCKPPAPPATQDGYQVQIADPSGAPTAKEAYVELLVPACKNANPQACTKWIPAKAPLEGGPFSRVKAIDLTLVDDDAP